MKHLLEKATKADVRTEPFPHIIVYDALDEETCNKLIEEYPSLDVMSRGRNFGSNERLSLSADDTLKDERISPLWKEFVQANTSQLFLDKFLELFESHIKETYPDFEKRFGNISQLKAGMRKRDTFKEVDVLLDAQPSANTPVFTPSSVRGPHLDNPDKLYFGLFYMRLPEDKSEGGELLFYKHKKQRNWKHAYSDRKNIQEEYLEKVGTLPYQRNVLFIGFNSPEGVHGVSVRSASSHPRYFLNILGEMKENIYKLPRQSTVKQVFNTLYQHAIIEEPREKPTFKELGFFNPEKKSIYVTNPDYTSSGFPEFKYSYNILYPRDIKTLGSHEKKSVVGIVTGKLGTPLSQELIDEFPNLKAIAIASGSLKKYNPEIAIKNNIPLLNVSETYAKSVAEFALMDALIGVRRAFVSHDRIRGGLWGSPRRKGNKKPLPLRIKSLIARVLGENVLSNLVSKILLIPFGIFGKIIGTGKKYKINPLEGDWNVIKREPNAAKRTLQGSEFGIVGFGPVAQNLITLLKPFHTKIKVYSEHLSEAEAERLGVEKSTLFEVCKCDVVSIHRGLSEKTQGSFGKKEISLLKPGAVLVNTSRGKILDEKALIERLKKGDIIACLDVFTEEPLPYSNKLRRLPNVFLTSHIANSTDKTYQDAVTELMQSLVKTLQGEPTQRTITKEMLERMT